MDQPSSPLSLEDPLPQSGAYRLPVRGVSRGGSAIATRGDAMNELSARTFNSLGDARLIRFPTVQERVGMGRTAVYELIKAGKFPRPVKVGAASAWIDVEITRWIEQLAAKRDALS